ncbi:putative Cystatin domain-containing protein [Helianthus debilis subsp. tardiflorus]
MVRKWSISTMYSVDEYNRLPRSTTANDEGGLRFSRVVEAEQQVVSGMKYYMKIEALTKSGDPQVFESVVVVKPWLRSKKLVTFGPSQAVLRPVW